MHLGGGAEPSSSKVAPADLDVAILGQLPAAHLPLGNHFEWGAIQVIGFKAALGRGALVEERLEHATGHANDALVLADTYAELNDA